MNFRIIGCWISFLSFMIYPAVAQTLDVEDQVLRELYAKLEFDMEKVAEPSFPEYTVSIVEHGAIGDGQTLNTKAIADAMDSVVRKGSPSLTVYNGKHIEVDVFSFPKGQSHPVVKILGALSKNIKLRKSNFTR